MVKMAKKPAKKSASSPVNNVKGCVDCGYMHQRFGHNECPLCRRCGACGYTLRKCRCIESE